jgi:hypothetical protein
MENVKLYFTKEDNTGGTYRSAGQIYEVPKHQADQIIEAGSARTFKFDELDKYDSYIKEEFEKYQKKAEEIKNNDRLKDEAKAEDLETLYQETKSKMDTWAFGWNHHLEDYKKKIVEQSRDTTRTSKLSDSEIDERAGIVLTEITMAGNLLSSVSAMNEAMEFMEQDVARRLLSKFPEIKNAIESNSTSDSRQTSSAIRRLHSQLKELSQNESTQSGNIDYKILQRLEENRKVSGHYPLRFKWIKDNPVRRAR